MNLVSAPIRAFHDMKFYREVMKTGLGSALLYLLYLAALVTVVSMFFFFVRGIPLAKSYVDWTKANLPDLTWTPEGLVMNASSPYVMIHDDLGVVATFDTTQTEVNFEDIEETLIYVTSTRLYVRQSEQEFRVYDLTRPPEDVAPEDLVIPIDEESVGALFDSLVPLAFFFILLVVTPLMFAFLLLEGLLYSLIALLLNRIRQSKLEYPALLNVSFFILAPLTLIHARGLLNDSLGKIPFGLLGSLIVASIYLFVVLKNTDEPLIPEPSA